MVGSQADADDVLQETFVRLARRRKSLVAVDNLVAYVFAIARHEAIRLVQRQLELLGIGAVRVVEVEDLLHLAEREADLTP